MALLRADIDKLRKAQTLLKQAAPEIQTVQDGVKSVANELESTWDGAASQYYIGKLRSHAKPLKNTKSAVKEFEKYAKDTADQMQAIDDFIQGILDTLSSIGGKKK